MGFGAAMPAFCLIFGDMIDSVGGAGGGFEDLKTQALYMVYLGLATWVVTFGQVYGLQWFSDSISAKIKAKYFKECLRKDAKYYDQHNPNEMAAKISKEVGAISRGTGEKVGQVVMGYTSLVAGFIFAFTIGWMLTLILLGALPFFIIMGAGLAIALGDNATESMKAYAQSAGYAE